MTSFTSDDLNFDSQEILMQLQAGADELQSYYEQEHGIRYDRRDLQKAMVGWLQSSVKNLLEDSTFHLVEGDRAYAFNRREFERQMKQVRPVEVVAEQAEQAA